MILFVFVFKSAIGITEEEQRKIAIHHVIQQLPPPHYRTLEYLLRHLSHVASFSSQTGMHAKNLAIVWAPNLLSPRNPDYGNTALLEINIQAILVEFLIRNTEELFDTNAASIAIVSNPQYNTLQERGPHHGLSFDAGWFCSISWRFVLLFVCLVFPLYILSTRSI